MKKQRKIALYLFLGLCFLALGYALAGFPALSPRQAAAKLQRSYLVGDARAFKTDRTYMADWERQVVALDDEYIYCSYVTGDPLSPLSDFGLWNGLWTQCRKRGDEISLVPGEIVMEDNWVQNTGPGGGMINYALDCLTVFVLDEVGGADRAEGALKISLSEEDGYRINGEAVKCDIVFRAEDQREGPLFLLGFAFWELETGTENLWDEGYFRDEIAGALLRDVQNGSLDARIEASLYSKGELLRRETIDFGTE